MELFSLYVLSAAVLSVLALGVYARVVSLDRGWRKAAKRLGLQYEPGGLFRFPRLRGRIGPCEVQVAIGRPHSADNVDNVATRVSVEVQDMPASFEVAPQSVWSKMTGRFRTTAGLGLGTPFDHNVKVGGEVTYALAVLDPSVRERLQQLTSLQGQIQRGELAVSLRGRVASAERLVKVVDFLVKLARDLALPTADWPRALRRRATDDPTAQVRRLSLQTLVDRYPDAPETMLAVRNRLSDFSPHVRLLAARHAGESGVSVVHEVYEDDEVGDELRGQALAIWSALRPAADPTLRASLAAALKSTSDVVFRVGAQLVASRSERRLRGDVLAALHDGNRANDAAAVVALGAVGDRDDLPVLVDRLSSKDPDVRAAAATALGRLGDRDEVAPLLALTRGLAQPSRVKEAARAAVAAIQDRTGGDRGGLSLIGDAAAGQLSVAGDAGALSTPKE